MNNLIISSGPEEAKKLTISLVDTTAVALKTAIMSAGGFTVSDNTASGYELRRSFRVKSERTEPGIADWQEVIRIEASSRTCGSGSRYEVVVERHCVVGSRGGRKRVYRNLSKPTWNKIVKDLRRAVETTIENHVRRLDSQAKDAAWKAAADAAFKGTAIPPGIRITPVMDNELPPANPDDMRFAIAFERYASGGIQNAHLTAAEMKKLTAVLIEVLHLDTAWIIVRSSDYPCWAGNNWNNGTRCIQTFTNKDLTEAEIARHKDLPSWESAKAVPYISLFNH